MIPGEDLPHRTWQFLQVGEGAGWIALVGAIWGVAGSIVHLFSSITVDHVQPWLILIGSAAVGAVSVGAIVYARFVKAYWDGEQTEAIAQQNIRDINMGKQPTYPQYLPAPRRGYGDSPSDMTLPPRPAPPGSQEPPK